MIISLMLFLSQPVRCLLCMQFPGVKPPIPPHIIVAKIELVASGLVTEKPPSTKNGRSVNAIRVQLNIRRYAENDGISRQMRKIMSGRASK